MGDIMTDRTKRIKTKIFWNRAIAWSAIVCAAVAVIALIVSIINKQ
jgi:hypothetical protein